MVMATRLGGEEGYQRQVEENGLEGGLMNDEVAVIHFRLDSIKLRASFPLGGSRAHAYESCDRRRGDEEGWDG
jgi:hypothetical protein